VAEVVVAGAGVFSVAAVAAVAAAAVEEVRVTRRDSTILGTVSTSATQPEISPVPIGMRYMEMDARMSTGCAAHQAAVEGDAVTAEVVDEVVKSKKPIPLIERIRPQPMMRPQAVEPVVVAVALGMALASEEEPTIDSYVVSGICSLDTALLEIFHRP
jgi:hypothetical protein